MDLKKSVNIHTASGEAEVIVVGCCVHSTD